MANRSGWTYGERIPETSEWLTVLGSAYRAPVLYGTQAEAQAALDAFGPAPHMRLVVAHVTERPDGRVSGRGYAYRITVPGPVTTGPGPWPPGKRVDEVGG